MGLQHNIDDGTWSHFRPIFTFLLSYQLNLNENDDDSSEEDDDDDDLYEKFSFISAALSLSRSLGTRYQ